MGKLLLPKVLINSFFKLLDCLEKVGDNAEALGDPEFSQKARTIHKTFLEFALWVRDNRHGP